MRHFDVSMFRCRSFLANEIVIVPLSGMKRRGLRHTYKETPPLRDCVCRKVSIKDALSRICGGFYNVFEGVCLVNPFRNGFHFYIGFSV